MAEPKFTRQSFAAIDWTKREIGDFVRALQDVFVRTAGAAIPLYMLPLLDYLDSIADAAEERLADSPSPMLAGDLAGWRLRSSSYRSRMNAASPSYGNEIAVDVTGPLLLGWYPGRPQQTVIDAATPIQIAHAATVNAAALEDAWTRFGDDLIRAAETAAKTATDTTGAAADTAGATLEATQSLARAVSWIMDADHRWRIVIPIGGAFAVAGAAFAISRAVRS